MGIGSGDEYTERGRQEADFLLELFFEKTAEVTGLQVSYPDIYNYLKIQKIYS